MKNTKEPSLRSTVIGVVVCILAFLGSVVVHGQSPDPGFSIHPIAQAPAGRLGAEALRRGGQRPPDPRAVQFAEWLADNLQAEAARGRIPMRADAGPVNPPQRRALAKLEQAAGGELRIRWREQNGTPMLIKGALQTRVRVNIAPAGMDLEQAGAIRTAREFLRANADLLLLVDPDHELELVEYQKDNLGFQHLRFDQVFHDLSVWPCELTLHLDKEGNVDLVNGAFIPTPAGVATEPELAANQAVALARQNYPDLDEGTATDPELIIFGPLDEPPCLAWKFRIDLGQRESWRFVVDAVKGVVRLKMDAVQHIAVQGSGVDGRGNSRTLDLWQQGNTFFMVDTSKEMFDPSSNPPENPRGAILIYDAANKEVTDPQFSAGLVRSSSANSGWDPDAVGAAFGLSQTYDYYLEHFNRNSLDGRGSNIRAIVRFGENINNAFWFGSTRTMVFGFGNTREVDISGHELTHGVINSVGNGGILEYVNQSGALNEALADIFGEMVEFDTRGGPDWLKRDVFEPDNRDKLLQDYADPTSVLSFTGAPNPSKMSDFIRLSQDQDNGGVHVNSSIINHCFYLLSTGMEGAIGIPDTERIFYRAMTTYLQKQSQFIDMRHACVNSAQDVFGTDTTQLRMTEAAFDRVEIFDAPTTPAPAPLPSIEAPDSTLLLRVDPANGLLYLVRREQALGDPVEGSFVFTSDYLAARKVSVSGDGSFAVFVTQNNDAGFVLTDSGELDFAELTGLVHSVAMAPSGRRYALVLNQEAFGQPGNEITIVDLTENLQDVADVVTIPLFAPTQDGGLLDVIQYADAMEFTPDSQTLIYDAFSVINAEGGNFAGWSMFLMDLRQAEPVLRSLIDLNEGFDFGNPSLGNVRPNLVTYEVLDKTTDTLGLFAGDLQSGETQQIGQVGPPNPISIPVYSGDDSAIIYAQRDASVWSGFSLVRQEVESDGITPVGDPTVWMEDGNFAAIYRRGEFVPSNQLPLVEITTPLPNQNFAAPADFDFEVAASDPDGSVRMVEFYLGSTKVAEDDTAPYGIRIENAPAGTLRLTARAIDELGAVGDSEVVEIRITEGGGEPLVIVSGLQDQTVPEGGTVEFSIQVSGGTGEYTYEWQRNGTVLEGMTGPVMELTNVPLGAAGNYTVVVGDGVDTLTSSANLMVTTTVTNQAPEIDSIPDQTVQQGQQLSFTVNASDRDMPAQSLTFGLELGAPLNASIDPNSGLFRWTPSDLQGPGTFVITVRVTDNGEPSLSDTASFQVEVFAGSSVRIAATPLNGGLIRLAVSGGEINDTFEIQASLDLQNWTGIATLTKTTDTVVFIDPDSAALSERFYRVVVKP